MPLSPELRATFDVARAFEKARVAYYLCGSMASSAQGVPRASADVDFVADLMPHHVRAWVAALGPDFEVDEEMLREAIEHRRSLNIFDLRSALKVDVFIAGFDSWDREQLKRARTGLITRQDHAEVALPSPEDTVLAKLRWYRQGGEVSDRQWADILGVLQVQVGRLDLTYMRRWAATIGVADLLERALAAS
ncbi:MAG: hypothetical protein Q8S33_36065 [Myxococcales bacterium]|nr:hypothetical protein [Myxococcales bacterium]